MVLEVPRSPLDSNDVRKAYRAKQLLTHPDKNIGVVGALEASQRVNAVRAWAGRSGQR